MRFKNVEEIDRFKQPPELLNLCLELAMSLDILLYVAGFSFGIASTWTHKSKLYNVHSYTSVFSIVSIVFLSYLHQIFLIAFLLRIVYYIYVRYVISLLHTILLITIYN